MKRRTPLPACRPTSLVLAALVVCLAGEKRAPALEREAFWPRHTIDDSSSGADGVRLADVNGDGRMDIATGWEEGGRVRVYLNPGPEGAQRRWPAVTVGEVGAPEDAVFADLDADGAVDVVSCTEGRVRTVWVHWAPRDPSRYLDPDAWTTEAVPALAGEQLWMFCLPMQVDGKNGIDLVIGAKGQGAQIGWLESPSEPRDLAAWKWHPLRQAGWIMSLVAVDMDEDGDADVLVSDRRGPQRGCFWLENPGAALAQAGPWREHRIGGQDNEVMFLCAADLDRDGAMDVLTATEDGKLILFRRRSSDADAWQASDIPLPKSASKGKAVAVADVDGDKTLDIVFSCEGAVGEKKGVMWLSRRGSVRDPAWEIHPISGPEGIKFDLVRLLDLDEDGDLDVITCEERTNLGVVWYENPTRRARGDE